MRAWSCSEKSSDVMDLSNQTLAPFGAHTWTLTADETWLQGRGLFGGLVSRAATIAMSSDLGEPEKTLRSFTAHFCAPAPHGHPLALTTELVRNGRNVATMTARLANADAPVTLFSASFARPREESIHYMSAAMPEMKAPEDSLRVSPDLPGIPRFLRHFEIRFASDAIPFLGGGESAFGMWARPLDRVALDAGLAVLLLDVPPPAVACRMSTPRAIASVDFTVLLFDALSDPEPLADGTSVFLHVTSRWANDGYSEELRDLWLSDGRLIGQCRQLIALL